MKAVQIFQATEQGQLSMEPGDILLVLQKDVQVGWWLVKRERDNQQGLVPSAFLQPVLQESSLSEQGIHVKLDGAHGTQYATWLHRLRPQAFHLPSDKR